MASSSLKDPLDCVEFDDYNWSSRKEVLEKMSFKDIILLQKSLEDPEELGFFLKFYHLERDNSKNHTGVEFTTGQDCVSWLCPKFQGPAVR